MKEIFVLTDYHGHYGSKYTSIPYRSGFNLDALNDSFVKLGYHMVVIPLHKALSLGIDWCGKNVLYTSSEEVGYNYKSYIEDIVYALELAGANLMPRYRYLRANNNKVFMELLRSQFVGAKVSGIASRTFGTLEELLSSIEKGEIAFPCVIKTAAGAMSRGVEKAESSEELVAHARRLCRTPHYKYEIKDFLRSKRSSLKGYERESLYQQKFIVQGMIPGLDGDWKVLVYQDQFYVLNRHVKAGDFRASGSHCNYRAGKAACIPFEVLDLAKEIYEKLNVPYASLDMAYDGIRPYLIEFQCLYFGTSTQEVFSNEYYKKEGCKWVLKPKEMGIEELNAYCVCKYIERVVASDNEPIS